MTRSHGVRGAAAPLVATMLAVTKDIHVLRDPTRGGLATFLNEIAKTAGVGVRIHSALGRP